MFRRNYVVWWSCQWFFESRVVVRDSKRNSAKLIEFTISLERRVWFLFISDECLIVGALQVQGTILSKTRNLVDQIIYFQEGVGIDADESVDRLAVIHC